MRSVIYIWLAIIVSVPALSAEPSTSLRVWKTYPDTLDLTLTSVFRPDGVRLQAAFNHRNGRTFFVYQGERMGPYMLHKISGAGSRTASAVLIDTRTSQSFTLKIDTATPLPGLRAQLADLRTSQLWDFRRLDELPSHGMRITSITATNVTASSVSGKLSIPPITQAERNTLQTAWAEARSRQLAAIKAAKRLKDAERAEQLRLEAAAMQAARARMLPNMRVEVKSQPRFYYGTEYRVPSSYAYFYTFKPTASGVALAPQVIAVPTEFETRSAGWSLNVTPP